MQCFLNAFYITAGYYTFYRWRDGSLAVDVHIHTRRTRSGYRKCTWGSVQPSPPPSLSCTWRIVHLHAYLALWQGSTHTRTFAQLICKVLRHIQGKLHYSTVSLKYKIYTFTRSGHFLYTSYMYLCVYTSIHAGDTYTVTPIYVCIYIVIFVVHICKRNLYTKSPNYQFLTYLCKCP